MAENPLSCCLDTLLSADSSDGASGFMHVLKKRRDTAQHLMKLYADAMAEGKKWPLPADVLLFWGKLADLGVQALDLVLTLLATLPDGVDFTIQMRGDILEAIKRKAGSSSALTQLRKLSDSMKVSFSKQVAVELRQIARAAPVQLQEFIKRNEAVHKFTSNDDLHFRLGGPGRRCYGLFHPTMPLRPLVFVQIALLDSDALPARLGEVLNPKNAYEPINPVTAVFYSVTNPMPGLSGLQLGSYLLFLCMEALQKEIPSVRNFATLSPAPGFVEWAYGKLEARDEWMLPSKEADAILPAGIKQSDRAAKLRELLNHVAGHAEEIGESAFPPQVRTLLLRWASRYILFERRAAGHKLLDPVANFHVSNGATVERLNFAAYTNKAGLKQSFGIMVNYRYDLSSAGAAARQYAKSGALAATKAAVLLQSIGFPNVFEGVEESKVALMAVPLCARVLQPASWLLKADDPSTFAFYILVMGTLDIFAPVPMKSGRDSTVVASSLTKVGEMHPGAAVGALAILENREPLFSFRARGVCYVLEVPLEPIQTVLRDFPAEAKLIRKNAREQLLTAIDRGLLAAKL